MIPTPSGLLLCRQKAAPFLPNALAEASLSEAQQDWRQQRLLLLQPPRQSLERLRRAGCCQILLPSPDFQLRLRGRGRLWKWVGGFGACRTWWQPSGEPMWLSLHTMLPTLKDLHWLRCLLGADSRCKPGCQASEWVKGLHNHQDISSRIWSRMNSWRSWRSPFCLHPSACKATTWVGEPVLQQPLLNAFGESSSYYICNIKELCC